MSDPQISRVLVGVDFDDSSAAALRVAGTMARALGATLTVIHAHSVEMPAYFTGAQMDTLEAEREERRVRCAGELQAFATQHGVVAAESVIEEGAAAATILRLAPAFDLVVVGTRRLHGPKRWWLGSVAEAVVRDATVPVLVVPVSERSSS